MPVTNDVYVPEGVVEAPAAEAFYGLAGDFVRLIEPQTEADPTALLLNFLVTSGSMFGREAYAASEPNLCTARRCRSDST